MRLPPAAGVQRPTGCEDEAGGRALPAEPEPEEAGAEGQRDHFGSSSSEAREHDSLNLGAEEKAVCCALDL